MLSLGGSPVLAQEQPAQAGPLGLFIILALAAVTVLLVRSMGRHLRRIPPTFDPRADDNPPATSTDLLDDGSHSAGQL